MSAKPPLAAGLAQLRAWDALRRPVWMFDPEACRGVYANPAALRLWEAESLEALLARDFSRLSPTVRTRTARLVHATAHGGEVTERWTFYPCGRPTTVQATISAYPFDGRPVLLFEASLLEVEAEERRAVEALRNTSAMITLFDEDGRVLFSNPAAYAAYGGDDRRFGTHFIDRAQGEALLRQALVDQMAAEVCEMQTRAGPRWHHLDARRVLDPVSGGAGLLLNEVDATRRVRAEQARAVAEIRASLAEARQRFLTDTSHELRTPLNAVIGFSQLLMGTDLMSEQREQVARVHESGQHLLAVVNQMISLSGKEGWAGERSPVAAAVLQPVPPPPASAPGPEDARALRVLYADDNAHNRALVTAILAAQGVECQTADDGYEACEAALTETWDLILMDIQMPVMDGVEAAQRIRACSSGQPTPILAVTANTLPDQVEAYLRAGMVGCIAKPIDVAALMESVIHWGVGAAEDTAAA